MVVVRVVAVVGTLMPLDADWYSCCRSRRVYCKWCAGGFLLYEYSMMCRKDRRMHGGEGGGQ